MVSEPQSKAFFGASDGSPENILGSPRNHHHVSLHGFVQRQRTIANQRDENEPGLAASAPVVPPYSHPRLYMQPRPDCWLRQVHHNDLCGRADGKSVISG
jgi:hypothetical protein